MEISKIKEVPLAKFILETYTQRERVLHKAAPGHHLLCEC